MELKANTNISPNIEKDAQLSLIRDTDTHYIVEKRDRLTIFYASARHRSAVADVYGVRPFRRVGLILSIYHQPKTIIEYQDTHETREVFHPENQYEDYQTALAQARLLTYNSAAEAAESINLGTMPSDKEIADAVAKVSHE